MVECQLPKLKVAGSNPVARSISRPARPSRGVAVRHPVVAILGRPNVGKSTLFNRILGERIAVTDDRPGVTKDRHFARADWNGRSFMLVDTGGFLPEIAVGIEAAVRRQAEMALDACSVALFLVDAKTGTTDLDAAIARLLLKRGRPALLVVNKADNPRVPVEADFWRLGLGEPVPISSEQGTGIGDLLDQVVALLPPAVDEVEDDGAIRVAIVGRPTSASPRWSTRSSTRSG